MQPFRGQAMQYGIPLGPASQLPTGGKKSNEKAEFRWIFIKFSFSSGGIVLGLFAV